MRRLFTLLIYLLLALPSINAAIFHVYKNSPNPGNGLTWNSAFTDMNSCIAAASIGDSIWVGAGVYFISDPLKLKSGMKIYGGFNGTESLLAERNFVSNKSVLWGSNSKILYFENTDSTTLVDGFSLVHGTTNLDANFDCLQFPPKYFYCMGGAAFIFSDDITRPAFAKFKNCIFKNNIARYGGAIGLYLDEGNGGLSIENCEFDSNSSVDDAGAISCTIGKNCTGDIQISNSHFHSNYNGYWGTGVIARYQISEKSSFSITKTVFDNNFTYIGTGVIANSSNEKQKCKIIECEFFNNSTGNNKFEPGTGGVLGGGYFDVDRCYFHNNKGFEGGVFWGGGSEFRNSLFINNQASNYGGAIASQGKTKILNSTFINNASSLGGAAASYLNSDTLINNIFWGNKADSVGNIFYTHLLTYAPHLKNNYFDVDSCQDIIRNIYNTGVIQECDSFNLIGRDLRFRDLLHNDFRLPLCSRTTNAGFNLLDVGVDLYGNPRIVGGKIDVGAIETQDTAISVFATSIDATLPTGQNGGISIDSIFGGWPPYSLLWDTGDTTWAIQNLEGGTYLLTALDSAGCESIQSFVVEQVVPVIDFLQKPEIKVSPNPFNETITITAPNLSGLILTITNQLGQLVKTESIKSKSDAFQFDFDANIPRGVYFLTIGGGYNETIAFKIIRY